MSINDFHKLLMYQKIFTIQHNNSIQIETIKQHK